MKIIKQLIYIKSLYKYRHYNALDWPGKGRIACEFEMDPSGIVSISSSVIFRKNCSIRVRDGGELKIGNSVSFNDGCIITCRKKIVIGSHVLFGPNVMIFDHNHDFRGGDFEHEFIAEEITIGDNVWIGANVAILKGSVIEDGAVIGANSVVTGHVERNSVYLSMGNKRSYKYK